MLLLNGCGAVRPISPTSPAIPPSPPPPTPSEYKPVTGPAAGLYAEAEKALQAGRYAASEMLLERALRIEPQNPHYWYTMAQVKYRQGLYRETVQFCLKAESLAGKQSPLAPRNRELLQQAQRAMQTH
jgi:tetratricopeptide (TPR) repeat protein